MRRFILCSLGLVILASPASADFLAVDYLPLAPGNFWAYLENGTVAGTTTVLPQMENVNGRSTFVLEEMGGEFPHQQDLTGQRKESQQKSRLALHSQIPGMAWAQ